MRIGHVVVLLAGLMMGRAEAQDPRALPLVQPGDVRYVGKFTLPPTDGTGRPAAEGWLTWGGTALGLGPDGASLYFGCHDWGKRLARVSVPALGGVGAVLEPCAPIANLDAINPGDSGAKILGGTLTWSGRLLASAYAYYDANKTAVASHFIGANIAALAGPQRVGVPGFVGGYMGVVPPEWRALLGGPALTGQCCLAIVGRTSAGPSASVFDPDQVGALQPAPSTMLVGYPTGHELGAWGAYNPLFTGATQMAGLAFPSGTRSLLFIGRHGGTFCYGSGTANQALIGTPDGQGNVYCYDPTDTSKGTHGYPYRHQVWAYDAADLAAVKQGTRQPWDVRPYAVWPLSGIDTTGAATVRSAAYDDRVRRIYMTTTTGDGAPTVHVFEVAAPAPAAPAEQTPATITIDPATTYQTMRGWETVVAADLLSNPTAFAAYRDAMLDRAVEAGINRVRLEVRSGAENSADNYGNWRAAGFPFSGAAYTTWRARRYETINDNADPNVINPAGFQWTELDAAVDAMVTPLRQRLQARGESLYVNLNYVGFIAQVTTGQPYVHQSAAEYAEFMVAAFQHLQAKYGWVPDGLEVVLEPDNTGSGPWTAARLDAVIAATVPRLSAAGFSPDIIAPSTVWMSTASSWWDALSATTKAAIKEFSYHRYGGVSASALAAIVARHPAPAMLEWWDQGNTFNTLHEDLTTGRNVAWQAGVISGGTSGATTTNITYLAGGTVPTFSSRTQFARRYMAHVRRGAVRVGASSVDARFAPVAFRNVDGRYAVIVKATAPGTVTIGGLPAGTYGIDYTTSPTSSANDAQTGARPDQTITAGQTISIDVPWGVTVIYLRLAPPPPPPPAPTATLVANPSTITAGQTAGLCWTTTDATSATLAPAPGAVTPTLGGCVDVSPAASTSYTLTATGAGGATTATAALTVLPPPPVACVETAGAWGPGPDVDGWSSWVVSGAEETRYRERTWTQTIAAANGGAACTWTTGGLGSTALERNDESRPYVPPPPPPPTFAWQIVSPTAVDLTITWQGQTFTIRLTVQ